MDMDMIIMTVMKMKFVYVNVCYMYKKLFVEKKGIIIFLFVFI